MKNRRIFNFPTLLLVTLPLSIAFLVFMIIMVSESAPFMIIVLTVFGLFILFLNLRMTVSMVLFKKEELKVFGDFNTQSKVQLPMNIKYEDITGFNHGFLPTGINSDMEPLKGNMGNKNQVYFAKYFNKKVECVYISLKGGKQVAIIINNFTKNQIQSIYDELRERCNLLLEHTPRMTYKETSKDQKEEANHEKLMPMYVSILSVLAFVSFFVFMIHSFTLGGDALNGYVEAGKYYVGNHGNYIEVTEREFITNLWLGRIMIPIFLGGFGLVGFHQFRNRRKLK